LTCPGLPRNPKGGEGTSPRWHSPGVGGPKDLEVRSNPGRKEVGDGIVVAPGEEEKTKRKKSG